MNTVTIKITIEHGKVKAKLIPEKHADERLVLAGLRALTAIGEIENRPQPTGEWPHSYKRDGNG